MERSPGGGFSALVCQRSAPSNRSIQIVEIDPHDLDDRQTLAVENPDPAIS